MKNALQFYTAHAPLLASVSRTFFLTIKILPAGLRSPIALAYLLARASDTIADSSAAPANLRLVHLAAFREMIAHGLDADALGRLQTNIIPDDAGEQKLILNLQSCFAWLAQIEPADRAYIFAVLQKIIHGQELDLQRFSSDSVAALPNAEALDQYTFLVAGCVGEFWTQLCFRHVKNFADLSQERMQMLGVNFGKGLQLVNILRDLPADLRSGRCYLPADELASAGLTASALLNSPELARDLLSQWNARASDFLDDGFRYLEAINHARLRCACLLPWYFGVRTLELLREKSPLEMDERIKLPRRAVRKAALALPILSLSKTALRFLRSSSHFVKK